MSALYSANHKPMHEFLESITDFVKRPNESLPPELFDLDVFDGSPPCSTFSIAGKRGKAWGKEKHFREGQAVQVLDSLPMAWVECALKLRPRVAIMENVYGMLKGDAKGFVREAVAALAAGGYSSQAFDLDAASMGVPQRRRRVFVIARRNDLALPPLRLSFSEPPIPSRSAVAGIPREGRSAPPSITRCWAIAMPGEPNLQNTNIKGNFFTWRKAHPDRPAPTLTATSTILWWDEPRLIEGRCAARLQSFPDDYDFLDLDPVYVCGMSVPPLMAQRIALEIRRQWLG